MNLPNLISAFRIVAAPVMWWLLYQGYREAFTWLLTAAFFSDMIDGFIARSLRQVSKLGSMLDSYGDSLTILTGITGLIVFRSDLFDRYLLVLIAVIGLHLIQLLLSLWRYRKPSSFHTWIAKVGALAIGLFILITLHFDFIPWFFYLTIVILVLDAVEESILVFIIPEWKTDVKGLWWVLRQK